MRTGPSWLSDEKRLDEYRTLSIEQAVARIIAAWRSAKSLHRGPGPIGMTTIPIESQLADWLARTHPETERLLYDHLQDDSALVRAYCIHTLLKMGSRLLLNLPDTITDCGTEITRCLGCSIVTVPLSNLFTEELLSIRLMFDGVNANKSSGWWRNQDDESP